MFYAEAIQLKLERIHSSSPPTGSAPNPPFQPFHVSLKLCAAVNSVLHVQQSIRPLSELCRPTNNNNNNGDGNPAADGAADPVAVVAQSAVKEIGDKLDEIFVAVARRASPFRFKFDF